MADFSNSSPDPLEAARRRHGFSSPEDLRALGAILELVSNHSGYARLRIGDRGGPWYLAEQGEAPSRTVDNVFHLQGTDLEGVLTVPASTPAGPPERAMTLVIEVLKLRQSAAERRRQPRGPEAASFVPGLTHELRNFIFAMGAGLDAFSANFPEDGEASRHGEALRRNLTRLQAFVEELGDYGNPSALAFSLRPVLPVLSQGVRLAQPLADAKGVALRLEPCPEAIQERMDPSALERALHHLVELAILETEAGGTVEITSELLPGEGRPWLQVTLSGSPGRGRALEPDRLFEPFYYRDRDMSRLGVAISRRLVEAHGGQVVAGIAEGALTLRAILPVWMEAP